MTNTKTTTIAGEARLGWAAGVQEYPLGDELLLYVRGRSSVHTLNNSARAIWERCDGSCTVREISRDLATPLGLSRDDLEADVLQAVSELAELGLLEAR